MRVKFISALFFIACLFSTTLQAQSFDEGLELYEQDEYSEAVVIFTSLNDDRSLLFAGKSYYALNNFSLAIDYLRRAEQSSREAIRDEATYTLALAQFGLRNYDQSLELLHSLATGNNRTGLRQTSSRLYNQLLGFLTTRQRYELLYDIENTAVRYDIVANSRPFMDQPEFNLLARELLASTTDATWRSRIERELLNGDRRLRNVPGTFVNAPDGMVYNVGVVLPLFDEEDPDFSIPRNLYYGMVMAAEEFNSRNISQKVNLIFKNSAENPDSTSLAMAGLTFANRVDAVLGPIFSEPAEVMADFAAEYQIPMVVPLANSDELSRNHEYTFQINPTPEAHGIQMARYAVNTLHLDTLAVIADSESSGRSSALAFRHEAEKLGATISYYIEEDFAATGYEFGELTEVFTPETELIDSLNYIPSEGIYAPFTGQAAGTMSNLLLNSLEAMRSDVVIMGSQEWESISLSNFQDQFFEIYYTDSKATIDESANREFFVDDYQTRYGLEPDDFSMLGFDIASFLLQQLETAGNPAYLKQSLVASDNYRGLSIRINMNGKRSNQHLFIRPLSQKAQQQ
jgi:ABC-type branched-subunit amino acid transport system substrate-binding protein